MTRIIILTVAAMLLAGAAYAATTPPGSQAVAPGKGGTIVNQTSGGSGTGLISQNFGDPPNNSAGADAFSVTRTALVETVIAHGIYFDSSGPATSETVTFYTERRHAPGHAIKRCTFVGVRGIDHAGTFTITLKPACRLTPGTYWVSVVVNMPFAQGGEWEWENATETGPLQGDWENPGGSGLCTTWQPNQTCFPGNYPTGYNYELLGKGS